MKHLNRIVRTGLTAICMMVWCPAHGQSFDLGGEIGNPFRAYISPSGLFGAHYPKTWAVLERHVSVSFVEGQGDSSNAVGINVQADPSVNSAADLAKKLIRENPGENWRQIDVNGKTAFLAETGGRGAIFTLAKPGQIVVTRFQTKADAQSKDFVRKVIYSVKTP